MKKKKKNKPHPFSRNTITKTFPKLSGAGSLLESLMLIDEQGIKEKLNSIFALAANKAQRGSHLKTFFYMGQT